MTEQTCRTKVFLLSFIYLFPLIFSGRFIQSRIKKERKTKNKTFQVFLAFRVNHSGGKAFKIP